MTVDTGAELKRNSSITDSEDMNLTESDMINIPINYYGLVYTILLFLIGVPGNITVFFVYSKKLRKNSTTIFILVLAVFDLVNCTVTLPTEIVMLLNPFVFHIGPVCKMSRFTTYTCNSSTAVILAAIAVDRYKRVCRPHGTQITLDRAKRMAFLALTTAVSFTWPSLIIYGPRTVVGSATTSRNISLQICEIDDNYVLSVYPLVYYSYMCFSTCGIYCILLTSYICIVIKMVRRRKFTSLISRRSVSVREVPDIHIEKPSSQAHPTNAIQATSVHSSTRSLNVCCRAEDTNCFQYEPAKKSNICVPALSAPNNLNEKECKIQTESKSALENEFLNVDGLIDKRGSLTDGVRCTSVHERTEKGTNLEELNMTTEKGMSKTEQGLENDISKTNCSNSLEIPQIGRSFDDTSKNSSDNNLEILQDTHSNHNVSSNNVTESKQTDRSSKKVGSKKNRRKKSLVSNTHSHTGEISLNGSNKSRMRHSKRSLRTHRLGKTTLMLLVVTVVYIVSFLPFLGVVIKRAIYPTVPLTYKKEYDILYEALYRSYLLNCAVNPVIYSFCNANFRKDCKAACRRRKYRY